jgi:hypothetical protein
MKQFSDFLSPPPYDSISDRIEQFDLVDRAPGRRHESMTVPTTQQLEPLVGGNASPYDDENGVWIRFADADHRAHCFRLGSCSISSCEGIHCDFPQSFCCRGHGCAMSNRVFSLVIGILATIALIATGAIIGWTIVNKS